MDQVPELELDFKDGAIEVSNALGVKLFLAPVVLFCCVMSALCSICALFPQFLEHRPDKMPDVWTRLMFLFIGGPMFFGVGLELCQPWFYRLRADAHGLTESIGWKQKRVFWSDVDSFALEYSRTQRDAADRCERPVLRDAQGAVLLSPTTGNMAAASRKRFLRFVQAHLEGKQRPYTPPPLQHLYEGKSRAWIIKRMALYAICILAFVGLWSAAMLWTIAHPELPNWVSPAIGLSVIYAPCLMIPPVVLVKNWRQKKLLAESEPAST